jgi:uncharacterized protein
VLRYASRGAFAERRALTETVAPMSVGSLIGAVGDGNSCSPLMTSLWGWL